MGWKKALIFGGAVLVLAACDRATAPTALNRTGSTAAVKGSAKDTASASSTTISNTTTTLYGPLCSGYVITSGDSTVYCPDQ